MDLIEAINSRRSVRKYTDAPVSKEAVEKLIDAAVHAPTAMNTQPWTFGVIQGSEKMLELSSKAKKYLLGILHMFPMMEGYRETLENPEFDIFYGAPTLVVIYARPQKSPAPQIDCAMAAENLMLAARGMGLATCWIGFAGFYLNNPDAKRELGVPADYDAVAPIIVGYPDGDAPPPEKKATEIVFWK
jgi:nitroreductase